MIQGPGFQWERDKSSIVALLVRDLCSVCECMRKGLPKKSDVGTLVSHTTHMLRDLPLGSQIKVPLLDQ